MPGLKDNKGDDHEFEVDRLGKVVSPYSSWDLLWRCSDKGALGFCHLQKRG